MFSKKKKKPTISTPSNFEHRVRVKFDDDEGKLKFKKQTNIFKLIKKNYFFF